MNDGSLWLRRLKKLFGRKTKLIPKPIDVPIGQLKKLVADHLANELVLEYYAGQEYHRITWEKKFHSYTITHTATRKGKTILNDEWIVYDWDRIIEIVTKELNHEPSVE